MISSIELGPILAPLVSAVGVTLLYHYIGRDYLGAAENEYWNKFRRVVLGSFDQYVRDNSTFSLVRSSSADQFVGTIDGTSQDAARLFEDAGYVQGVLSSLKVRGRPEGKQFELGSMVYRESRSDLVPDSLAVYQNHVFWFDNGRGGMDVYAHHEYSSANPLVAWQHYRAVGLDAAKGKSLVAPLLAAIGEK